MAAGDNQLHTTSIATVQGEHRDLLIRAMANVLSSPIAEITYAQIFDGLPLSEVAQDVYDAYFCQGHPVLSQHQELCPGVAEQAREYRSRLDATALHMDSRVGETGMDQ